MTITKQSPRRVAWPHIAQSPFVIGGLGALIGVLNSWIDPTTGLVILSIALVCSIVLSFLTMKTYRCPDCSARLKPPERWWTRFPGSNIPLYCARCDVDWDFGIRGQED